MSLITARVTPIDPVDPATSLPQAWAVVNSKGQEECRYNGADKALAELFVTEFNVKAYEVHTRLRIALGARSAAAGTSVGSP